MSEFFLLNAINFRQKFLRCKDKGVEFFYAFETFFDAITLGTIDFDTRTLGASIIVINILEIDSYEYTARNNILGVTSKHTIKSGMRRGTKNRNWFDRYFDVFVVNPLFPKYPFFSEIFTFCEISTFSCEIPLCIHFL